MDAGAAGIVYGRNVIQHERPAAMTARADGDRPRPRAGLRRARAARLVSERVVGVGIVGGGLMGRELASAAARWIHLADLGVRPEIVCRLRHEPRRARAGTSVSTPSRAASPTTASCSRTRRRGRLLRRPAPPPRGGLHRRAARRQAPARREAVRHRPRRERGDQRRDRARTRSCSSAARRSCRSTRAARRSRTVDPRAALRPRDRGALALPPLLRPRSGQADQLEADRALQRRVRRAWATSACTRSTCRCAPAGRRATCARSSPNVVPRAARRGGRDVPCDTWDNAILLCNVEARRLVPAADRDEADRARRDEHLDDRDRRHRGLDRASRRSSRRRCG